MSKNPIHWHLLRHHATPACCILCGSSTFGRGVFTPEYAASFMLPTTPDGETWVCCYPVCDHHHNERGFNRNLTRAIDRAFRPWLPTGRPRRRPRVFG